MNISVIIPAYNSAKTLEACLDSLFKSEYPDYEVIVIDDKSRDHSLNILKNYPCKIIALAHNAGAANARNIGANQACGDILVFIDSDVVINPDTLDTVANEMISHPKASAVTGLLAIPKNDDNFFSEYKNLYMNYIFKKCIGEVDFLYGSFMAIRKKDFVPFDTSYPITDDTELGQRLKSLGKTIILSSSLEIVHLKKYSFLGFIKNDFQVPFWWTKTFLKYQGTKDVLSKQRFSHSGLRQIANILLAYLILACTLFWGTPALSILTIFLSAGYILSNSTFFLFIDKNKKGRFLMPYVCLTFLDHIIMGLGIACGFLYFGTRIHKTHNEGTQ